MWWGERGGGAGFQVCPHMDFLQILHVINTRPSNYKNDIVLYTCIYLGRLSPLSG